MVHVKQAGLRSTGKDGFRVLLGRSPRRKGGGRVDEHLPALGPSPSLRRWAASHPDEPITFRRLFFLELGAPEAVSQLEQLHTWHREMAALTLLHSGTAGEQAAVLIKGMLEGERKPPSGVGSRRAAAIGRRQR